MKCIHCEKEADYDSPAPLCEEHWIWWWVGNEQDDLVKLTPEEAEAFYQEVKESLKDKGDTCDQKM